ncbi:MAG: hypothetical protein FJZ92_09755 [Chloroflexi bacterium]|nr:hypothetical protein [Chloroflexota bacterium]
MTRDGWEVSSEGDLDPDLTEEADYGGWEPPRRRWLPLALRIGAALVIAALALSLLAVAIR